MTHDLMTDEQLDARLRHTLRAVAATVNERPQAAPTRRRRLGRRSMGGLGVALVAVPLAAGAVLRFGPEYVDELPPDDVVGTGEVDGQRYWMVESFHTDECGDPMPGVELVPEEHNVVGQEWSTAHVSYQRLGLDGCAQPPRLRDPARWDPWGGLFLGDTFMVMVAVHPDVSALSVRTDGQAQEVAVHPVDGAGYAVFEVPPATSTYTVELLDDASVIDGSARTLEVPSRE